MNERLFHDGSKIIKLLHKHGYEAYFVGGSVRDYLLHQPIHDIDLVTSATPKEIMEIFSTVIPLGIEHGTVIVRFNESSFELTTYRYQKRVTGNNATYENNIDPFLYNDLKHRDFTINAIAMDINNHIIDPFFGQDDLKNKIIRGVHDPYLRLREDPLRILRAFRFASVLGYSIEQSLMGAIKKINPQIETLAPERISQEFVKMIQGQYVQQSLADLIQAETYRFLPLIQHNFNEFLQLPKVIKPLNCLSEFFALMNYLNKRLTIKQFVKTWKSSRQIAFEANHLLNMLHE